MSFAIPPQHPSDVAFCPEGAVSCVISSLLLNADNRSTTRRRNRDQNLIVVSTAALRVASETTQPRALEARMSAANEDTTATNQGKTKASKSHLKSESIRKLVTAIPPIDTTP